MECALVRKCWWQMLVFGDWKWKKAKCCSFEKTVHLQPLWITLMTACRGKVLRALLSALAEWLSLSAGHKWGESVSARPTCQLYITHTFILSLSHGQVLHRMKGDICFFEGKIKVRAEWLSTAWVVARLKRPWDERRERGVEKSFRESFSPGSNKEWRST